MGGEATGGAVKKIADYVLYHDRRFYAAFPAVVTLADARLLLVFRRARDVRWLLGGETSALALELHQQVDHVDPRSQLVAIELDAEKMRPRETWELPRDPEAADQDASVLRLEDGSLLLASFSWYPVPGALAPVVERWPAHYGALERTGCLYVFWGGWISRSMDGGRTWSERCYLPALPGHQDSVPGQRPLHGGALRGQAVLRQGEILVPSYGRGSYLFASSDYGVSWQYRSVIAEDPSCKLEINEPALCLCPSGKLMAFMRSERGTDRLVTAESWDGGHSWSPWRERNVVGHPFHPLPLPDGRVLLSYGYRHRPYGIRARLLDAECTNVDDSAEFVLRDDGAGADVGYPWGTVLSDGRVLVVYYFVDMSGVRHIAATVLTCD
jgi:hypothetical protein